MTWNLKTDRPIYLQLSNYLRLKIVSGCYPPGSKLPSVRELAAKASVSPNTMMKALDELEAEGLIHPMNTRGIFITEDMEKIKKEKDTIVVHHIQEFFHTMESIGLSQTETFHFIEKFIKGGNL